METSLDQKKVTEEKIEQEIEQVNDKLDVLYQKPDKTDNDRQEIETLKQERKSRYQDKINLLTKRAKTAEEAYGSMSEEVRQMRDELAGLKSVKNVAEIESANTVMIGDKAYYSDEALEAMVAADKMTAKDAYRYQRDRDKAEIKVELRNDFEREAKEKDKDIIKRQTAEKVFQEYPHFAKKLADGTPNPDFDSNDPLYLEAVRIYNNGYNENPRGLLLAIEEAKRILGYGKAKADMSDHYQVGGSDTFGNNGERSKSQKVEWSKDEEETAFRLYRNQINPSTRRQYTDSEIISKAKAAKSNRLANRRVQ